MSDLAARLDIPFPLFAFSHCRDVVAAVTRAGGFGVLGIVNFEPDELERELAWVDAHVDGKPYGVDILMPENMPRDFSDEEIEAGVAELEQQYADSEVLRFEDTLVFIVGVLTKPRLA